MHDPVVEIKIVTRISWERCNLVSIELSENNLRKLRRYNGICENDYGTILKKFKVYFFSYILVAHIYLFNCQVFLLKKGERECKSHKNYFGKKDIIFFFVILIVYITLLRIG